MHMHTRVRPSQNRASPVSPSGKISRIWVFCGLLLVGLSALRSPAATVASVAVPVQLSCIHHSVVEEQSVVLRCPEGSGMVNITFASYGGKPVRRLKTKHTAHTVQNSSECLSFHEDTVCHATLSVYAVSKACLGLQTCKVDASNPTFEEDPCPNRPKFLTVAAICQAGFLGEVAAQVLPFRQKPKVPQGHGPMEKLLERIDVWPHAQKGVPRIYCGVNAIKKEFTTKCTAIKATWGSRCDMLEFLADAYDASLPAIHIKHPGKEEYGNIWQKTRESWRYVYEVRGDDFEWFVYGGTDMYWVMENLRQYVLSPAIAGTSWHALPQPPPVVVTVPAPRSTWPDQSNHANYSHNRLQALAKLVSQKPKYLGRRFKLNGQRNSIYNSGAGYVLNRGALKLLADHLKDCNPHGHTFAEDAEVGACFRKYGLPAEDTQDDLGRDRFHPMDPGFMLNYRRGNDWFALYSINLHEGWDCCSNSSVLFHYIAPQVMYKMDKLLYHRPTHEPVQLKKQASLRHAQHEGRSWWSRLFSNI